MIVLGADLHKSSHTIAAVAAATGELLGGKTIQVGARGFATALEWSRGLNDERVWALEDCRHVSGSFERFLIGRGERVVRVAPRLMADSGPGRRRRRRTDASKARTRPPKPAVNESLGSGPPSSAPTLPKKQTFAAELAKDRRTLGVRLALLTVRGPLRTRGAPRPARSCGRPGVRAAVETTAADRLPLGLRIKD